MKYKFSIYVSLLLIAAMSSCRTNQKTIEQIHAECDSLRDLSLSAFKANLREISFNYCNQAIHLDTTYWKNYCIKGYLNYLDKSFDSAVVAYEKFYQLNSRHDTLPNSMYRMARSYRELGQYDRALVIAQEGLLTNPNNFWLMDEVSLCYALQKKYDLAEKWAMKELEIHYDDANAYFRLAWINGELGRTSKAIEYYENLLEIEPENPDALNNLGIQYWNKNRGKAIELLVKAAKLGEEHARNWCKENGYDY